MESLHPIRTHQQNYGKIPVIEDPKALCVLIHGLGADPSAFDDYYDDLSQINGITIFQPYLPNAGHCSLDDAVESMVPESRGFDDSLITKVSTWAKNQKNVNKPIILVGISNGALIAGHLSVKLRGLGIMNPLQVSCISGPFLGTTLLNHPLLPSCIQSKLRRFSTPEVINRLSWNSDEAQSLIKSIQRIENVDYRFFSTVSDFLVTPFISAYPRIPSAHYYITSGEGHISIARAVRETVVKEAIRFSDAKSNSRQLF